MLRHLRKETQEGLPTRVGSNGRRNRAATPTRPGAHGRPSVQAKACGLAAGQKQATLPGDTG